VNARDWANSVSEVLVRRDLFAMRVLRDSSRRGIRHTHLELRVLLGRVFPVCQVIDSLLLAFPNAIEPGHGASWIS